MDRFFAEKENCFDLSVESARLQAVNVPLLNFIAYFATEIILLYSGVLFALQELSL